MLYNLKEWLRQAPKDALVKAANIHSVSNGITTPWQLRRMLWDNYTWNYGDSNSLEVARYLSACIGEQSMVTEHPEHGHLIVKTIEYDIQVALGRDFKWSPLEASKPAQEERMGEALTPECEASMRYAPEYRVQHVIDAPASVCRCGAVDMSAYRVAEQARMAAPQQRQQPKCGATVYGPNGVSQVDHVVDMPNVMCRCEMATIETAPEAGQEFWEFVGMADKQQAARLCLTPDTVVDGSLKIDAGGAIWLKGVGPFTVPAPEGSNGPAFVPVEPNPDSLDDLYLEDLLGHYNALNARAMELKAAYATHGFAMNKAAWIAADKSAGDVYQHIQNRFEKQGWLISRIKDR